MHEGEGRETRQGTSGSHSLDLLGNSPGTKGADEDTLVSSEDFFQPTFLNVSSACLKFEGSVMGVKFRAAKK